MEEIPIFLGKPSEHGYYMPAEWEPHAATWLTWPHDEAHWPGKFDSIPPIWARMVKELEIGEEVHILIHDDQTHASACDALEKAGVIGRQVRLHRVPNNFSWARDHGPIFLKDSEGHALITHWPYNAWGNKYAYDLDCKIPAHIARITGLPIAQAPMILEGGAIDVNGKGTLLTTEACLRHPNRNPHLGSVEIEQNLKDYLGVRHVLWLHDGIIGDDTNGHVDDLTRFVAPATVVTSIEDDNGDPNYLPLRENLKRLQRMTDQAGRPLRVIELHLPAPVIYEDMRLPASYANFYIGNEVVLLTAFNDRRDQAAIDVLQAAFPTRRIAALYARDLIWGLGAFHCVTQQQPLASTDL
ncbi:MAG: agmatine deiminase family protein [Acidobacteria bacterium]|nr:agmatine deiminase family protein [Acidobacteriota bacterium]MBI3656260.1 agmatine deiminase family protein [Acidobacteriota bacterium]